MLKRLFIFFIILCLLGFAAVGGALYYFIVMEPGDEVSPENIRNILGKESEVYYSDGMTKLGVFFDTAHRQYVSYPDIPSNFVNALVAAEDDRFFSHFGFDVLGIGRAMIRNIQAGRIVQGGSTLTQQTAKNLFKRQDRSFEAKLKELLYALRLEYYYSKEEIFEFYANQFYVSGNGHGLGVAARYYFDKTPQELTLTECAFIAGSVKSPNRYNPFIKNSKKGEVLAKERGFIRLKYVLGKMQELGMIDGIAYSQALGAHLNFQNGRVGYALDYVMAQVRDAVSSSEVLNRLEEHGVSNIATSGVKIITTVDRNLQRQALAMLRGELSRLDVRLRGYPRDEYLEELAALDYTGDSSLEVDSYLFGTIDAISGQGKDLQLRVTLDKKLGTGIIDAEGIDPLVTALVKYEENRWAEAKKGDARRLLSQLKEGDRVWVRVRSAEENQPTLLELEKYPQVQGGAIIVRNGQIKGMAGGTENRFFNRAVSARRTMGSAFKPLVYTAALQLGWNTADLLRNSRDVFVYHGQPYFPRPDHKSEDEWVSMSWAGVRSENLASVWLLYHLCDQLSVHQFRDLAQHLGFTPRSVDGQEEPYRSYSSRIRDRYGIVVTRDVLRRAAYRQAVLNLEVDFVFDGLTDDYNRLKTLHYGLDYSNYYGNLHEEYQENAEDLKAYERRELELRKSLLISTYLRLEDLYSSFLAYRQNVESYFTLDGPNLYDNVAGAIGYDPTTRRFSFSGGERAGLATYTRASLVEYLKNMDPTTRQNFWDSVLIGSKLSVAAMEKLGSQIDLEYQKMLEAAPYSFEVLSKLQDFRVTVGLYYLRKLAEELGVQSPLEAVLSFPLGSNVVTLFEATRMYEGMITGKVTSLGEPSSEEMNEPLAVIDRIESEDGVLLYQPKRHVKKVVDQKVSLAIGDLLENVVKFGTGRYADQNVRLKQGQDGQQSREGNVAELELNVPLMGKTGTANRYTNASFFGFLPGLTEKGSALTIDNGYAVGVYVGFDDNRPMRRGSSRISGAAGALPTWSGIVNAILEEQHYAAKLDPVDLSFYGLTLNYPDLGQYNIGVAPGRGGVPLEPVVNVDPNSRQTPAILTFGKVGPDNKFVVERDYHPFWMEADSEISVTTLKE